MSSDSNKTLEDIYHRAQDRIWDGRATLEQLINTYGSQSLPPEKAKALQNIFAVILAGEMAAWRISLQLADSVSDVGARMAATSQAHDEARHFYVMRDYLKLINYQEQSVPAPVTQALKMILDTDDLAKKLLGMQLMVEPVALTIFQEVRRVSPEPVLAELLKYFERDEARHVALGVHHLPVVAKNMGPVRTMSLISWQLKIFMLELEGLKMLREDFTALGLSPEGLFDLAEKKQLDALRDFVSELGLSSKVWEPIRFFIRYQKGRVLS